VGRSIPSVEYRDMRATRTAALAFLIAASLAACGRKSGPAMEHRIGLVYFAPEEGADMCMKGLFDGLKEQGIEERVNLEVRRAHAQAEIANIPLLIQNYDGSDVDVIVAMTTPVLTAAAAVARSKPVVFTYIYDPIAAGAGKSRTDHLPNVTGVYSFPPVQDTVDMIQRLVPGARSVGTLYNSSEANSVKVVGVARGIFEQRHIQLQEIAITGTSEVFQAAHVLTQRGVQALWVTGDNTAIQGFDAIVKAARDAKVPLIINDPEFVQRGALVAVGIGWYETGKAASKILARVLHGEHPRNIPFEEFAVKKVVLNQEVAKALGITFPPDIVQAASP
jgi:putative tryptophan/tyrosine transport system substrate-binding protein